MRVSDWVAAIAPVVAVIASAMGVLLAFEQLTLRARVRRIAEWSSQLASDEDSATRKAALLRTRTWASGQLVASVLVPARHYMEGLAWGLGGPALVAITPSDEGGLWLPLFAFGATSLTLRRTIRVHCERYQVARDYCLGREVTPPRISLLLLMEGGRREEFLWAGLGGGGLICAGYGVRMFIEHQLTWGLLTVAGVFVTGLAYIGVSRLAPPLLVGDVTVVRPRHRRNTRIAGATRVSRR